MKMLPIEKMVDFLELLLSSLGFGMVSITALSMLVRKEIGHRLLVLSVSLFFAIRAVVDIVFAFNLYGTHASSCRTCSVLYLVSSFSSLSLCGIVMASRKGVLVSLKSAAKEEARLKLLHEEDLEQKRLNFDFLNKQNMNRSLELIKICEAKSNGRVPAVDRHTFETG